jgi:hypothetical protein
MMWSISALGERWQIRHTISLLGLRLDRSDRPQQVSVAERLRVHSSRDHQA